MFNQLDYFKETSETLKLARNVKNNFSPLSEGVVFVLSFFAMLLFTGLMTLLFIRGIPENTDTYILVTQTCFIFSILFTLLIVTKVEKRNLRGMGFSREKVLSYIVKGFCLGFVMFLIVTVIGTLVGLYKFDYLNFSTWYLAIPYLLTFIIQSFAEEIYTRGWVIPLFSRNHSVIVAIGISVLLFVVGHAGNIGFNVGSIINLVLVSVLLAFMLLKFDNIWICGGVHSAWNFTQGYLLGFNVSGINTSSLFNFSQTTNNIISGGAFGPESGLIVSFVLLLVIIFVYKIWFSLDHILFNGLNVCSLGYRLI